MSKLYEDKDIVFRCVCSGYHYFEMNAVEWPEHHKSVFLTFVERPKSMRERFNALKSVFSSDTVYHGELEIDDLEKFKNAVAEL